jgi:hypothetical protein
VDNCLQSPHRDFNAFRCVQGRNDMLGDGTRDGTERNEMERGAELNDDIENVLTYLDKTMKINIYLSY